MSNSVDIYTEFFGLRERPFSLVPDPDFLFWTRAHSRALATLEYGIMTRAPITMLTGEVGAGKTTVLHHLLDGLGDDVQVGLINNAHSDRGELLRWVLQSLGSDAEPADTYVDMYGQFQELLIKRYAEGKRVVLIFDEAQNLSTQNLEELRIFTNINSNKDELLQLILVGQPELRDMVRRPELRQFAQRVAAAYHLPSMEVETVGQYIAHRLKIAGTDAPIFAPTTIPVIHQLSGGVPRLVNQLCDFAMLYAYVKEERTVTTTTLQQVLDDGIFFPAELPAQNPITSRIALHQAAKG